jgi:hypothetical protein
MEPLHRVFALASEEGVLSRLCGRANDIITLLYADGAVFFINPLKAELEAVRGILSCLRAWMLLTLSHLLGLGSPPPLQVSWTTP